jgi:adenylate cyclase
MKRKNRYLFLIPLIIAAFFSTANFTRLYRIIDNKLYDFLLRVKPGIPENESILFVDIDDVAISKVGIFPWSRDIMADGLILMKEFDANYAVFDIEYTDKSPRGINDDVLSKEIPELFSDEFSRIDANMTNLFQALKAGTITLKDMDDYVGYLSEETSSSKEVLLEKVGEITRDNDAYLGKAAKLFGNAYFTVNMLDSEDAVASEQLRDHAVEAVSVKNIEVDSEWPRKAVDIRTAIMPILAGGKGAGFVNIVVDEDGVQRRIDLLYEYRGNYFAQLTFATLLDWLDYPSVQVSGNRIILKNARFPDGEIKDITIPLTEKKQFLIHWPNNTFSDSFRHLSYWNLVRHKELENRLVHNLKIMEDLGYLSYYRGEAGLLQPYIYAEEIRIDMLQSGDSDAITDYREARTLFFTGLRRFLHGDAESNILSDIDHVLSSGDAGDADKEGYRAFRERIPEDFSATREIYDSLIETREILAKELTGAFCIIGLIGTSTTDTGVTPIEEEYMNVGTHAALINTILTGLFLSEVPLYYSIIAAVVLSLLVTFIIRNLKPLPSILIGVGMLVLLVAGISTLFVTTGLYINLLTPAFSVFFTFLAISLVKFLKSEQEKSFLKDAFSHYLSTDVINQLILDPEKLNLGGEKKQLTALFTDIRGFSGISEHLDPVDLVKLLNAYLTEMSNIILDLKGTIDKYEGDAIISFFGAPVNFEDHARRACLAAVRMKNMESHLNEHFLKEKLSPAPLLTRIGANTGEMIVGNMGTSQKMDYTVMGNSVNLASRLEGVNKQYGTWILISENTYNEAGGGFTVRRLDRVRVAGIREPVRLYELFDEEKHTDTATKEAVKMFHIGLKLFEEKKWNKALDNFKGVMKLLPQDGPSSIYIKRCSDNILNPPPQSWDGVFNLRK